MSQLPSTPDEKPVLPVIKTEPGLLPLSQGSNRSRSVLGMRSVNATPGPSRLSGTPSPSPRPAPSPYTHLHRPRKGVYGAFKAPARIRPFAAIKSEAMRNDLELEEERKADIDEKPDVSLSALDTKPDMEHHILSKGIKRTRTPLPDDVRTFRPGSRFAPIVVEDDDTGPVPAVQPSGPTVAPIIQKITNTYNVVHIHQTIVYQGGPPPNPDGLGVLGNEAPRPAMGDAVQTPRAPIQHRPDPPSVPPRRQEHQQEQQEQQEHQQQPDGSGNPVVTALIYAQEAEHPVLSRRQQAILDTVLQGHSVLIHGSAGTGKSVLIRAIKQAFAERYEALHSEAPIPVTRDVDPTAATGTGVTPLVVLARRTYEERRLYPLPEKKWKLRVTASTGLAAVNVGGTTFHGFIGAGLCKGEIPDLVEMIQRTNAADEWTTTAAVVIDENGQFFDRVDQIGRIVRGQDRPFGGLQIIACGDFLQLAPVGEDNEDTGMKIATYAFDSVVWDRLFRRAHQFNLEHNFRQGDPSFRRLLERMRRGYLSTRDHRVLGGLCSEPQQENAIKPVFLMPRRKEVDQLNHAQLKGCAAPTRTFRAVDCPGRTASGEDVTLKEATKRLNDETRFAEKLELRIGAQVMLLMNMKEPFLVNGSTGQVTDFMTRDEADIARIPEPSITDFFDPPRNVLYPVVRFAKMRGCQAPPPAILIPAMTASITTARNVEIAARTQVPMILAWALTIHKAQGQTLDRIKVDVKMCRYAGQAYTAISRVTTKEGLQLLNFTPKCVQVDAAAGRWVRELEGDDDYMAYVEEEEE